MKLMAEIKKSLRNKIISKRDEISIEYQNQASSIIKNKIIESNEYKSSKTIMIFVSFSSEVDTKKLIEMSWKLNKKVVTSKANMQHRKLHLYYIDSWDQLQEGVYGILEPKPCDKRKVCPSEVDMVIYPGVAFDKSLNRLGYGGGFYDRFYKELREDCHRIAIAYDMQIIDKVPIDKYDIPVDKIITEKRNIL